MNINSKNQLSNMNIYLELINILEIIKNETSIENLYHEFLKKSSHHLGIERSYMIFVDSKQIVTFPSAATIFENIEVELNSNIGFLAKYFESNSEPLFSNAETKNAAYNFLSIFNCNAILALPLFFNNKFVAAAFYTSQSKFIYTKAIEDIKVLANIFTYIADDILMNEKNKALENKLVQTQKLETLGKLAGGIAHDFSNLLSSIFGSVNLLRRKMPAVEEHIRLLDNIENCAVRAKDLTKGLLSYGKPTSKRRTVINSSALYEEIVKIVAQTLPKDVKFQHTIDDNLYSFLGNDTEISQVILNLCLNAKEALKNNGRIILKVRNFEINEKNNNKFPLLIPGKYVRFTIRDNGSGISQENLQKIFDPYFSTKKKEQTSGLGLYVSYGIIKGHKGYIDVKSKLGIGTSFDVFIPAVSFNSKDKLSRTYQIILLADDEFMLIDLLGELLETSNYSVIKVLSGKEALKLLTEEIKVDLIILDYNMPGMNGLECAKKIRKFDKTTPIILSTGSISVNENTTLSEYGINSIVPKPYEFDTLLATIQKLI